MNKNSLWCFLALVAMAFAATNDEQTSEAFSFNILSGLNNFELILVAFLLIALGLVNLLFGLRYSKIIIFLLGFIISACSAFAIETIASSRVTFSVYLIAFISGVIGGAVFYFCYHCSIFTIGFVLGAGLIFIGMSTLGISRVKTITCQLIKFLKSSDGLYAIASLAGGICGGILALKINDLVLIVSTSFAGGFYITWAICIFIEGRGFASEYSRNGIYHFITIALGIGGIIFQLTYKPKSITQADLERTIVSAPDVYVINMNSTQASTPSTERKF